MDRNDEQLLQQFFNEAAQQTIADNGFTEQELLDLDEFVHSLAHIIMELSQEGGFDNASSF